MRIEDIDTNSVSMETLNKSIEVSRDTYNDLAKMTSKVAKEIEEAFETLKREWDKAVKAYINEIEKIKEGK